MKRSVAVFSLLIAACGSSPPTRFYVLGPVAGGNPVSTHLERPIKVDAVHIPSVLDRTTIIQGERHYQLSVSSQDRWAADFGAMVRRVLTQDLESRLPAGAVITPDTPAPSDAGGVVVDILSFEPDGTGAVKLDAEWTLLQGSPAQPALQRDVQLSEPSSGSVDAQAAAMSRLIGRLADEIARGVLGEKPS